MIKPSYEFSCFKCGYEMEFTPSHAMQTGTNMGHGKCPLCEELLELSISEDGERGVSNKFRDEEIKEELNGQTSNT